MFRKMLHSILFSLLALVGVTPAFAADCPSNYGELECYVDTSGYDYWTTDYCFGEITASSTFAYFRLENTAAFGDSTSPTFQGWSPNCTSVIGSSYSSTCKKTINKWQTLVMKMVVNMPGGGTCTIPATAEAEGPN